MPPDASGPAISPAVDATEVRTAAHRLGLDPSDAQVQSWLAHLALIEKWNRTYNLTSVRELGEMRRQHLFDCLAVLRPLQRVVEQLSPTESSRRLLDVGSGGGLPGVVIAIGLPLLRTICVDTVGKKAAFLTQVATELRLRNLTALHARVEALPPQCATVVTSRAFASLADFTALTSKHLAENGVWLAMKGQHPQEEIDALPPAVEVFHVEPLTVPGMNAERCLVWMRPR